MPNARSLALRELRRVGEERVVGRIGAGPAALDVVDAELVQLARDRAPCPRPRSRRPGSARRRARWCRRGRSRSPGHAPLPVGGAVGAVLKHDAHARVSSCRIRSASAKFFALRRVLARSISVFDNGCDLSDCALAGVAWNQCDQGPACRMPSRRARRQQRYPSASPVSAGSAALLSAQSPDSWTIGRSPWAC